MSSIVVQRLNMDSSWLIKWGGISFVLDPWLVGSEVDGFKWLNEQWHITNPIAIDEVKQFDAILISNPYSDHCHLTTLRKLDNEVPLLATNPSCKRIKKEWKERQTTPIGYLHKNRFTDLKHLKITALKPERKWIDPIYHSLLISNGNESIFYSAHGLILSKKQLALLKQFNIKLLFTTFTWFQLPAIMGGIVNPGYETALQLANQLNVKYLINTHDEQKKAKGLVNKLAKVKYHLPDDLTDERIVQLNDYLPKELS